MTDSIDPFEGVVFEPISDISEEALKRHEKWLREWVKKWLIARKYLDDIG